MYSVKEGDSSVDVCVQVFNDFQFFVLGSIQVQEGTATGESVQCSIYSFSKLQPIALAFTA